LVVVGCFFADRNPRSILCSEAIMANIAKRPDGR
jgi:hypothetical protein